MSNLIRWEPSRDMLTLREAMDRLIDDAFTQHYEYVIVDGPTRNDPGAMTVLDLADVSYLDRRAVRLLRELAARSVELINCPPLVDEYGAPRVLGGEPVADHGRRRGQQRGSGSALESGAQKVER